MIITTPKLDSTADLTAAFMPHQLEWINGEVKVGVIKFDNGSRIIAFSANPQAMAVYGGDVGLDEFAKHQNARFLWETAQGGITWGYDLAIWSSHDGEDTLFNEFAQEARATLGEPGACNIQPTFSYLGRSNQIIAPETSSHSPSRR